MAIERMELCDHSWDGVPVSRSSLYLLDEEHVTATCSKCGMSHVYWEFAYGLDDTELEIQHAAKLGQEPFLP